MIARRRKLRAHYADLFAGVPGVTVFGEPSAEDNCWLSSILVDPDVAGFTAEDVRLALLEDDIEARPLWKPMHLQPVFAGARAFVNGTSQRLFETGLSLPSGSVLTDAEVARVDAALAPFTRGGVRHG